MTEEIKVIKHNVYLLNYMFTKDLLKLEYNEKEKDFIFSLITQAIFEDPFCYMRILLYFANIRKGTKQELFYKYLLHTTSIIVPDYLINNLELLTTLGKKQDVLYLMNNDYVRNKTIQYITHKSKYDQDFKELLNGNMIDVKSNIIIRYKPKTNKNNKMSILLNKILDDVNFNGITV